MFTVSGFGGPPCFGGRIKGVHAFSLSYFAFKVSFALLLLHITVPSELTGRFGLLESLGVQQSSRCTCVQRNVSVLYCTVFLGKIPPGSGRTNHRVHRVLALSAF
jgi:hypothetical protein